DGAWGGGRPRGGRRAPGGEPGSARGRIVRGEWGEQRGGVAHGDGDRGRREDRERRPVAGTGVQALQADPVQRGSPGGGPGQHAGRLAGGRDGDRGQPAVDPLARRLEQRLLAGPVVVEGEGGPLD